MSNKLFKVKVKTRKKQKQAAESKAHLAYFDGEAEDLDAHSPNIRCCHLSYQTGKFVSILVNLFNGEGA